MCHNKMTYLNLSQLSEFKIDNFYNVSIKRTKKNSTIDTMDVNKGEKVK